MIFDGIDILSSLKTKLAWLNDRQAILSRNIANASTPGFVPQDLTPPDFSAALAEASRGGFFATTNSKHMRGRSLANGTSHAIDKPDSQTSPDGNRVVIEEQMMRVAETQLQYAEATGLYKKVFSLWRTALGAGSV
ncbi:MAG: flagellar biosynthesis protein FlgB [Alphaproteobacteria bacterium]|jgi:flagellar basal-body rod protein FlgB|nr:flagellar biosynthesis protein FlgB [Alphaproteobacteria bacterium]